VNTSHEQPMLTQTEVVPEKGPTKPVFAPSVDIHETDTGLVLQADLPGVALKDLEVEVESNVLSIVARTSQHPPTDSVLVHQEYGWATTNARSSWVTRSTGARSSSMTGSPYSASYCAAIRCRSSSIVMPRRRAREAARSARVPLAVRPVNILFPFA